MIYLTEQDIINIHDFIIDRYGGATGILNNTVSSIIFSTNYYDNIIDIAASYLYKINKDHIFRDGNKRTACLATIQFITLNNKSFDITNDELYKLSIDIAENKYTELTLKMKLISYIK